MDKHLRASVLRVERSTLVLILDGIGIALKLAGAKKPRQSERYLLTLKKGKHHG